MELNGGTYLTIVGNTDDRNETVITGISEKGGNTLTIVGNDTRILETNKDQMLECSGSLTIVGSNYENKTSNMTGRIFIANDNFNSTVVYSKDFDCCCYDTWELSMALNFDYLIVQNKSTRDSYIARVEDSKEPGVRKDYFYMKKKHIAEVLPFKKLFEAFGEKVE